MLPFRVLARARSVLVGGKPEFDDSSRPRGRFRRLYNWPLPPLDPSRETAWLDGLRGVAAFLVVTYHYHLSWWSIILEAPYGSDPKFDMQIWRLPFIRLLFCAGHVQVSIFFVLSGFVLSWSSLGSIRRGQHEKLAVSLSSSTFRRWIRLYMPCFVVGLVAMVEARFRIVGEPVGNIFDQFWDYLKACERFSNPIYIDRQAFEYRHDYSWTMWTIPHEFAGSLLVFVIILGVARVRDYRRRTFLIGFITFYAFLKAKWTYWLFSTGILLADYIRQSGGFIDTTNPTAKLGWILMLIVSMYIGGMPEKSERFPSPGYEFLARWTPAKWQPVENGDRFWWSWAGIFFIVSACHLRGVRRFFELDFMRYLGKISYMLYLTHRHVYELIGEPLWRDVIRQRLLKGGYAEDMDWGSTNMPMHIFIPVLIFMWAYLAPIAILVADWGEQYVDAPSVRLARWVDNGFVNGFAQDRAVADEEMVRLTRPAEPDLPSREPRLA